MSKKIKKPLSISDKKKKDAQKLKKKYTTEEDINNVSLESSLEKNLAYIDSVFDRVSDVVVRRFQINSESVTEAALIYIDGLVSKNFVNQVILKELMVVTRNIDVKQDIANYGLKDLIKKNLLNLSEVEDGKKLGKVVDKLLSGNAILLLDGYDEALILSIQAMENRGVKEPDTESVVRGPRDGFVEDVNINMALLRKRIKTSDLKFEPVKLGRVSKTNVVLAYIQGIVPDELVEEVRERVHRIDTDMILESGNVEQLIEDDPFSPFPQMNNTERPDGVAAALNEGRVAIMIDGTPFTLLVPSVFVHFIQANEDYYERFLFPTAVRLLRLSAFVVALLGPSVYIAITTFHQEMIPTRLLISIVASRTGVPFPAIVEALLMEVSFEALREAGLRLPKPVGQAVSIVGALVVGESAVQAGLVSQAMVIVVALTGIASFIIPAYNMSIGVRLLRFPVMFLAASWGMFGITFAILALLIHLASLRSFGVPYLSPITPTDWKGLKDAIFKSPEWFRNKRAPFIVKKDTKRIKDNSMPTPPKDGDQDE